MVPIFLFFGFLICVASCNQSSSNSNNSPTPTSLSSSQLVFDSDREDGRHEIYVMNTDGSQVSRLTHDAAYENWWPRISPDRSKVMFYRSPVGIPEDYTLASLWVMNADGSSATQLRTQGEDGWTAQGHGEWSPDGTKIAMFGSANSALEIFVTDANGKNPVQYTNRGGINTDVSWSPDGTKLLFNGCPNSSSCVPANYEIYMMDAIALSAPVRITFDSLADYDPYYSPDGTKIAWLVNVDPTANVIPSTSIALGRWAIRIATIGSNASYLIDDGHINSKPAWSLDSQTIYFHRMVPSDGYRFRIFSITPAGTQLTELTLGSTGNSEHPSN